MINVMVNTDLMEVASPMNEDKQLFPPREKSPRRTPQVSYTLDGRKLLDGVLVSEQPPEELWEKTLVRAAAVHQMHDVVDGHCDDERKNGNDHFPVKESPVLITESEPDAATNDNTTSTKESDSTK
uniref:Uncharacterized protein n=1 Tax=Plectus sambesii TaxID=2011161 RepID=A0A914VVF8_9BILA